jgi:2-methylisocitrate lyase-like PEP mutase family enzyme
MSLAEAADALRALHVPGRPLVLPNAWDATSARLVMEAGFTVVATTSAGLVEALGYEDGGTAPPDEVFAAIGRISRAVSVPVTADIEAGYGLSADELVDRLLAAGAVGCNLEDGRENAPLRPLAEHAERVAAARAAGERAGVPIVINARTDVFIDEIGEPGERVELALERGRAYLEAGADCIFVPAASDPDDLRALVAGMGGPVSVLASPRGPSLAELQSLGVARASLGPGSLGIAMSALRDAAESLLARGPLEPALAYRP